MSEEWSIPAPAFKADEALVALKRQLRELRPLAERGARFELRGVPVVELALVGDAIEARLAQRPTNSTAWTTHPLSRSADLRTFVDSVRRQMRRWDTDE